MTSEEVLKKIKKTYGERFMKLCRSNFPTILEKDDKLFEILQASFSDISGTLYEDIKENELESRFVDYVFEKFESETVEKVTTEKTPYELLDEAGYDLVECHSEEEIQSFKKYYAKGEELCTFHGERLDTHVVYWAVKKDVDEIKRKDFKNPERDDLYGTSVMSIQFSRSGKSRVSIKNRYNHTVDNPDATLGNNLENIAPGLTNSFERELAEKGLCLDDGKNTFDIPSYVRAIDGKYYKYNCRIGNTFYCPENTVIVGGVAQKIPEHQKRMLIDCFVLDTEKKTISMFDESKKDAFVDVLTEIQKIDIVKDKTSGDGRRNITIYKEGVEEPIVITIDKDEKIIGYKNHELSEVGNDFLRYSFGVETLDTPNIQKAGNNFCRSASIEELTLPKLETAGDNFCASADNLKRADLSSLTEVGDNCLATINSLEELSLPKLKKVGNKFCRRAHELKKIELPELIEAGDESLEYTRKLKKLEAPKLQSVGNEFCCFTGLESIRLQSLETVGDLFCQCCQEVRTVDLPQVKTVGDQFMEAVENVESVRMPNLSKAGDAFLLDAADTITEFEAPKISRLKWFFSQNKHMVSVINRTKKIQKIKKTDIVVLDASKMLMPEEIEEAKTLVEEPTVEVNRDNIRRTEEI